MRHFSWGKFTGTIARNYPTAERTGKKVFETYSEYLEPPGTPDAAATVVYIPTADERDLLIQTFNPLLLDLDAQRFWESVETDMCRLSARAARLIELGWGLTLTDVRTLLRLRTEFINLEYEADATGVRPKRTECSNIPVDWAAYEACRPLLDTLEEVSRQLDGKIPAIELG